MKNQFKHIVIILMSLAFAFETVSYVSALPADQTMECGENSETEESFPKTEAFYADDDYSSHRNEHYRLICRHNELSLLFAHNSILFTSDYAKEVYSPPELL